MEPQLPAHGVYVGWFQRLEEQAEKHHSELSGKLDKLNGRLRETEKQARVNETRLDDAEQRLDRVQAQSVWERIAIGMSTILATVFGRAGQ
jgi:TolA-binding protein